MTGTGSSRFSRGADATAETDGATLAYTYWKGTTEPVLLIPGLGSARHVYQPLIDAFPEDMTLVSYDPRGIGESSASSISPTMERLGGDALAVADAIGAKTLTLFGASMGGMVAQHAALLAPERVKKLVIAASTAGGKSAVKTASWASERLLGAGAKTPGEAYRIACTVLYSERFQQEHPEFIDSEVAFRDSHPVRGRTFMDQRSAIAAHDLSDRLGEIAMPVLVQHGLEDLLQPAENGRILARGVGNGRFSGFSGSGHLFFHEEPERCAEEIVGFVRGK